MTDGANGTDPENAQLELDAPPKLFQAENLENDDLDEAKRVIRSTSPRSVASCLRRS